MSQRLDLGEKPRLGYAQSRLERAAERRNDQAWLKAAEADPRALAYAVIGDQVVLKRDGSAFVPTFTLSNAHLLGRVTEQVFLGHLDEAPRFGIALDPTLAPGLKTRGDLLLIDLRSIAVQGLVAVDHLPPLAEGKALLHWHARHRFCPNCSAPTAVVQAGWRRDCTSCATQHFPRTDPVVIMLAVDRDRCVLGRSGRFVPTMWSCLAGFIEPGEAIEDAVRREVREEVGLKCGTVKYFASQPWPFPTSLMIGCYAEARSHEIVVDREELEDARWFDREEVIAMMLKRHPQGLTMPPPIAIAHHIIRAWLEGESGF